MNAEAVEKVFLDCLFDDSATEDEIVEIEGIVNNFAFNSARLEANKNTIISLLEELPDEFRQSLGGGWSFLNACNDKHGSHWGEHRNMEQLFVLGIGINKAKFLFPRKMWSAFPGGLPYVVYLNREDDN